MKKVLITGANGYIGRHVVNYMLDKGYEVYAASRNYNGLDTRAKKCNVEIFSGNKDIYNQLGKPDICIHLAWRDGFIHNSNSHIMDLSKHYEFLLNMVNGGLKNLSVMGTMHEIGYWEGAIDEETPCKPLSMYGIAKNSLRQSLEILAKEKDINLKWLRAYYIMGDDLRSNSIFSKITKMEQEGKKKIPFTRGKNKYDFISIDHLAEQICKSSIQNEITGIINCCTGVPVSLGEKVEEFIKENNFNIKLEYGAFPDRPYDSPGVWGDNSKIKKILENNKY